MNKFIKKILSFALIFACAFTLVSCGNNAQEDTFAETIELTTASLGDVEFENGDEVTISKNDEGYTVGGKIGEMSNSQKIKFGVNDVSNVVVLKFTFDKEKTLSSFEIKGSKTKVFSSDNSVENYVGSLSDLLDNEQGEDAYCNLILSAHTTNYDLTATYSDGTNSVLKLKINATLTQTNPS